MIRAGYLRVTVMSPSSKPVTPKLTWEFPKIRGTSFGALIIVRILLFRVLYWGPLFSETPIWGCLGDGEGFKARVTQGFSDLGLGPNYGFRV